MASRSDRFLFSKTKNSKSKNLQAKVKKLKKTQRRRKKNAKLGELLAIPETHRRVATLSAGGIQLESGRVH